MKEIIKLAEAGDSWAMYEYANYLRNVENKWETALVWFEKAADLGYDVAQFEVGCTYKYGWHVEKDYKKAVTYFNLAIEQGNKSAMFELGGLYELGYGVEKNMEKAKELYQKYKAVLDDIQAAKDMLNDKDMEEYAKEEIMAPKKETARERKLREKEKRRKRVI